MLLSRTLARRRIAAGKRPSWVGAWWPVAFDALCLILLYAILFVPFRNISTNFNFSAWASAAALFALLFIPIQGVLIFSSLWAARSRWEEKNDKT